MAPARPPGNPSSAARTALGSRAASQADDPRAILGAYGLAGCGGAARLTGQPGGGRARQPRVRCREGLLQRSEEPQGATIRSKRPSRLLCLALVWRDRWTATPHVRRCGTRP